MYHKEREGAMKALACLMIISVLASPLRAQDTTRVTADSTDSLVTPVYRNPKRALILGSVIPGAGHIYSGEYWHGFLAYETTVAGIIGGVGVSILGECAFVLYRACSTGPQWRALGVGMVGVGIWAWISSARDSPHAAERANAKHQAKMRPATAVIEAPIDSRSGWRVGAEIHF
jgi:hypothetical protein